MKNVLSLAAAMLLVGCASQGVLTRGDARAGCASLVGASIGAAVESATLVDPAALSINERAPFPGAAINPATPEYCKVLGAIAPSDPKAPPIKFEVNLPSAWNGRSVQYGGGGFNGVLITGLGLVPAAPYERPSPLAQGFVTVGTDSGHQNQPNQPPQAFALNDEALVNFAHASYKKVRDVSIELMQRAYGKAPAKLYFVGSSEGGREGLTMAQRYPDAFDGIFSRVPVIHWTGLQHAGLRDGLTLVGDGWIPPVKVKLVNDAVLAACDAADGVTDGIVSDPVGCRARFDVTRLRCTGAANDACLSDAQVRAVQTLHADLPLPIELANGLRSYPGRGPSGEALAASGPAGGWMAWWTGASAPAFPPRPDNGIAWFYGAGAIQYFYAQDPNADLRSYRPENHAARVRAVSALMDSTNPDLSAFRARGGKLIVLENLGDYAQSPYAGIAYVESVKAKLGREQTADFLRLYTAPGVDHVGTGGPANADIFGALVSWVEQARAPAGLTLFEQAAKPPFATLRSRPLCEWPALPRYREGDANAAPSFDCKP
jgi:feruloyl esterase